MTRARRWRIAAIGGRVLVALFVAGAAVTDAWCHVRECTYYGAHSNLLRIGERVAFSKEFQAAGGHSITKSQAGIVQEEPAWDEDSCGPDRPIKVALASGEVISVPRHVLHRE
jgi:hypothetical protein